MSRPPRPLLVLDGNSIAHRALHAGGELSHEGTATGLILIFLNMLRAAADRLNPRAIWVAWDSPRETLWRRAVYPGYKGLSATPDAAREEHYRRFYEQRSYLADEILPHLGVGQLRVPGFEADDIVAYWAHTFSSKYRVIVYSGDRDMWQLIQSEVWVLLPEEREGEALVSPATFRSVVGFDRPADWLEYRVLTGDDSDKIPGVGGIGAVRGRQIVENGGFESAFTFQRFGQAWLDARRDAYRRNRLLMDLKHGVERLAPLARAGSAHYMKGALRPPEALHALEGCGMNRIVTTWEAWSRPFGEL